jgi:hypothetical protein
VTELETIPVHVLENYMLSHELEAEYLNSFRKRARKRVNSTTALMRFKTNESRGRYFNYLAEAHNAGASIVLPPPDYCTRCWNSGTVIGWRGSVQPCPMPNCQARLPVIERFKARAKADARLGLVHRGQSQLMRRRTYAPVSTDSGVLDCS